MVGRLQRQAPQVLPTLLEQSRRMDSAFEFFNRMCLNTLALQTYVQVAEQDTEGIQQQIEGLWARMVVLLSRRLGNTRRELRAPSR